jgi:integrase
MKRIKTTYPGVRYRIHPTRKHGINQDRYFTIRYRLNGKTREEGIGWASQGMTAKKASVYLSKLREARLTGDGPQTLKEQREQAKAQREYEKREGLTFAEFFEQTYLPLVKANKSYKAYLTEQSLYKWIFPVVGDKPLPAISPLHLERIKKSLADAGRSPGTIRYTLALIRQCFNQAKILNLFEGDNPVSKVKMPHADNRRVRFLSHTEADVLLRELAESNKQLHDMALLSLHTGMRAGEIFNLAWSDVDLERQTLFLKDTKSRRNRTAYLTEQTLIMLIQRKEIDGTGYVFKNRNGGKIQEVTNSFTPVIKKLGFNAGITDRRNRVVFHTLRHSFASWCVEAGVDLYTVKTLLGHSTLSMTERYSHLSQGTLQEAVRKLDRKIKENEPAEVVGLAHKLQS